jgi:hypothetical protein
VSRIFAAMHSAPSEREEELARVLANEKAHNRSKRPWSVVARD